MGDISLSHCSSADVHTALTPPGTWHWRDGANPFHGSLKKRAQWYSFDHYRKKRDMKRIYADEPTRWTRYIPSLLDTLTRVKKASPRQRGRRTKHVFDWMAHASNLAKGSLPSTSHAHSLCSFCSAPETQHHINVSCTHPPVVEVRQTMQREIMLFFQKYRHHHLPQQHRWIIPIVDYIEDNLWADSIEGGDIWNGRWTRQLLLDLMPDSEMSPITPKDLVGGIKWLQQITAILQRTQKMLYTTRRAELLSKELKARADSVVALRRKRAKHGLILSLMPGASLIVELYILVGDGIHCRLLLHLIPHPLPR
jgi:hypothetical protein